MENVKILFRSIPSFFSQLTFFLKKKTQNNQQQIIPSRKKRKKKETESITGFKTHEKHKNNAHKGDK